MIGRKRGEAYIESGAMNDEPALEGAASSTGALRVLVVEDEPLVLMLFEDLLEDLGCVLVGPAMRVAQALKLAEAAAFDFALLDVNLAGESVYPVAATLEQRGLPFAFCTGHGDRGVDPQWRGRPILSKPFGLNQLKALLAEARARGRS